MSKYRLIQREEGCYQVTLMTRLLGVSRSGYYAWKKRQGHPPSPRTVRRQDLADLIGKIWIDGRKILGVRRIHAELAAQGITVSRWLVWQIMRELGIAGIQPRASKRTTIPALDADTRSDLLGRGFTPPVPTTCLVGDITYLKTGEGWLYLATVIDLTTRMVVGWQTAPHMRACLVVDSLAMAHRAGYTAGGAIFHSDRGAQFTSRELAEAARLMDIRLSVGRTGVCWDNAVAESFFASLKNEHWHHHSYPTRARARLAVADYIEVFYNRQRRHSTIGYQIPAQAMSAFLDRNLPQPQQQPAAA